ncbi:MAG: protein kinase [Clostridiales bacterium]|jgi:serine/threonine protein kinase|nr:protein kinase [Clostridiales bacterium]
MEINERAKAYEPIFGEYEVEKLIGEGNFSSVFKVRKKGKQKAALKIIPLKKDDVADLEKFKNEIEILRKIPKHENIAEVRDFAIKVPPDKTGMDLIVLMDLFAETLQNRFENEKYEFTEDEIINVGISICSALEVFHKMGIEYRGIKPENILISSDNKFRLADLSVVKRQYAEAASSPDKRNDIFSLGLLLREIKNKCDSVIKKEELFKIIQKATEKDISQRYQSAMEMKKALQNITKTETAKNLGNMVREVHENRKTDERLLSEADEISKSECREALIRENTEKQKNGFTSINNEENRQPKSSNRLSLISIGANIVLLLVIAVLTLQLVSVTDARKKEQERYDELNAYSYTEIGRLGNMLANSIVQINELQSEIQQMYEYIGHDWRNPPDGADSHPGDTPTESDGVSSQPPTETTTLPTTHTVVAFETLASIAIGYYGNSSQATLEHIRTTNNLTGYAIQIDQILILTPMP